ncbi:hypothetical protein HDU82_001560 [Entophlyctis luteolus]|nr:hypothetical protein HDU82_001560 [Entophlyctis luteolus]
MEVDPGSNFDNPDWANRWRHPDVYMQRSGPYAVDGFVPGDELTEFVHSDDCKILVVGAGGLGCELLKNLALMGFKDIQFKDVGKSKAEVAAEFIMSRVSGCKVTPYFGKIQDKDEEYYSQFSIIICGLDSVDARRWMNATILGMYDEDDPTTLKPIVDGGTEGFKGQSRVIIPKNTACYECSLSMQTKPVTFPICTIANTPRLPEHCIQYASILQWPKAFPERKIDGDDPDHIDWLFKEASSRAEEFGIRGVTRALTMGVVKNIIPAIASTNAIVAAATANEAFKLATSCAPTVNNYMMYVGDDGLYTYTFSLERKDDCPVCGTGTRKITISSAWKLQEFVDFLLEKPELQLKNPSLRTANKSLYMQSPKALEQATRPNLELLCVELFGSGDVVVVTDAQLPISLQFIVNGFTVVMGSRKRERRTRPQRPVPSVPFAYASVAASQRRLLSADCKNVRVDNVIAIIESIVSSMSMSTFFLDAVGIIRPRVPNPCPCVCYGIGSLLESSISRHQLAFIILMSRTLKFESLEAFDPVTTSDDEAILTCFGIRMLEKNDFASRKVISPTVFYMPHCPTAIFSSYSESPQQVRFREKYPLLLRAFDVVSETTLNGDTYENGNVFNNTSLLHFFGVSSNLESDFWDVTLVEECFDEETVS